MPKKLEGYHSGHGRQYNPYHDHWLWLWYDPIEGGPNQLGLIFVLHYLQLLYSILVIFIIPFGKSFTYTPIFYFVTPSLQLVFMTPIHNSLSCDQPVM